ASSRSSCAWSAAAGPVGSCSVTACLSRPILPMGAGTDHPNAPVSQIAASGLRGHPASMRRGRTGDAVPTGQLGHLFGDPVLVALGGVRTVTVELAVPGKEV